MLGFCKNLISLIVDPENQEYILRSGGVNNIADCLTSSDEQTVLSAITTLIFLLQSSTKSGKSISVLPYN